MFFFFGSLMASYAATTLAIPGTVLDKAWELNNSAQVQLAAMGRIMAAPFAILALVLFLAGVGWFKRRHWGWVLGVSVIAVNLTGDLIQHDETRGAELLPHQIAWCGPFCRVATTRYQDETSPSRQSG
jgi:hypothetical protein